MVRSVYEVARCIKIHFTYNVLTSGKSRYLATHWCRWYRMSQFRCTSSLHTPVGYCLKGCRMYLNTTVFLSVALQSSVGPWPLFQFFNVYAVGRIPWTGESTSRKAAAYTRNNVHTEYTHTNIHALSEIRTHDPSVRAGKDGSFLRPSGHRDNWQQSIPD
jgi:hypothetical protein